MAKKNIQKRESITQTNDGPDKFEYKPANGKIRSFKTGHDMWRYAVQTNPKLETEYNERTGPFLCDWFDRRRSVKN